MSKLFDPNLGVVACKHVAQGERDINLVTRYSDGDWSFTCGRADHSEALDDNEDYVFVHIVHLLEKDPAIEAISDLTPAWSAERYERQSGWHRYSDPA
jgi:hypothetical protein